MKHFLETGIGLLPFDTRMLLTLHHPRHHDHDARGLCPSGVGHAVLEVWLL